VLLPNSLLDQAGDETGLGGDEAADELVSQLRQERDRLLSERDQARAQAESWRVETERSRLDAARSTAERDATSLALDKAETELARLRRPWWRKLIGE
jgi:hypothetical protein